MIGILDSSNNILIVSIMDYPRMESEGNMSVSDWEENRPLHDSNLRVYTKMHFLKESGFVHFWRKNADHTVIELKIYRKEDSLRRALYK